MLKIKMYYGFEYIGTRKTHLYLVVRKQSFPYSRIKLHVCSLWHVSPDERADAIKKLAEGGESLMNEILEDKIREATKTLQQSLENEEYEAAILQIKSTSTISKEVWKSLKKNK